MAAAAAVAVAVIGVAACGSSSGSSAGSGAATAAATGSWQSVVAAAEKEGSVMFYTALTDEQMARITAAFEKSYPKIKLQYFSAPDGTLIPRLQQEVSHNQTQADVVFTGSAAFLKSAAQTNALMSLDSLPDASAWKGKSVYDTSYFTAQLVPSIIMWNTNLVKQPITDYTDLLRPALKGKIGTLDPSLAVNIVVFDQYLQKAYGQDFLTKLGDQQVKLYEGGEPQAQAVASGEIAATGYEAPPSYLTVKASGAPVADVLPPHAPALPLFAAALAGAPHPNAARVLADWLLSSAGQAALNPSGEDVQPLKGLTEGLTLLHPEDLTAAQNTQLAAEQKAQLLGS
jgi:iron(III) transport system substrate-binding protein